MANILILEDNLERIERFVKFFQNTSMTLLITDQVDQCIDILQHEKIDLAYLDYYLGGRSFTAPSTNDEPPKQASGLHVAEWISQNQQHAPATVIIHTTSPAASKAMHDALLKGGITQVFVAPFPACLEQFQVTVK